MKFAFGKKPIFFALFLKANSILGQPGLFIVASVPEQWAERQLFLSISYDHIKYDP